MHLNQPLDFKLQCIGVKPSIFLHRFIKNKGSQVSLYRLLWISATLFDDLEITVYVDADGRI